MNFRSILFMTLIVSCVSFFPHHRTVSQRRPQTSAKRQDLSDRTFTQKVDHNSVNSPTFSQRYWVNDMFFNGTGYPIFLFVGGEVTQDFSSVTRTKWVDYAENNAGILVTLEHRYFGLSQPSYDLEDLTFLTVAQAMQDVVNFITWYKSSIGSPNSPVIAIGSSYGGNLASWLRIAYPSVFSASLASSAPVQLVKEYSAYYSMIKTSIDSMTSSTTCTNNINQAMVALQQAMSDPDAVTQKLNLCYTLENTDNDRGTLVANMAEIWSSAVQYVDQSKITEYCGVMTRNGFTPLDNLAEVNRLELERDGSGCLNSAYDSLVEFYRNNLIDPNAYVGYRQYFYLQCQELGLFLTTGASWPAQPFGSAAPIALYDNECRDTFGTASRLSTSIPQMNSRFGGKTPTAAGASRILYSNGALDPWRSQSVTTDQSADVLSFVIGSAGHSDDMYPAFSAGSLKTQQTAIGNTLAQFIKTSRASTTSSKSSTVKSTTKASSGNVPSSTTTKVSSGNNPSSTTKSTSENVRSTTTSQVAGSTGVTGNCPKGLYACGAACYSDKDYCCQNGQLQQITFCKVPDSSTTSRNDPTTRSSSTTSQNIPSTRSSTTSQRTTSTTSSSTSAFPSTSSSSTTSQNIPTTKPSTTTSPKTSTSSPSTTNRTPAACKTNLCASCCPDARTNTDICYSPSMHQCLLDEFNSKTYLCGAGSGSCNGQCYQKNLYYCKNGVITYGKI